MSALVRLELHPPAEALPAHLHTNSVGDAASLMLGEPTAEEILLAFPLLSGLGLFTFELDPASGLYSEPLNDLRCVR